MKNLLFLMLFIVSCGGICQADSMASRYEKFGKLPVMNEGRIKPLDTVARNGLLFISGKQSLLIQGKKISATAWLYQLSKDAKVANTWPIFRVRNPEVLTFLGHSPKQTFLSYDELTKGVEIISDQASRAREIPKTERSVFQRAILLLNEQLNTYDGLANSFFLMGVGPFDEEYMALPDRFRGQVLRYLGAVSVFLPVYYKGHFYSVSEAYRDGEGALGHLAYHQGADVLQFIQALRSGEVFEGESLDTRLATVIRQSAHEPFMTRVNVEYYFNRIMPFYQAAILYLSVCVMILCSWLFRAPRLKWFALAILGLAFAIHTIGLGSRIWILGRPPVTNLYSSAVFVGWCAVLGGFFIERQIKMGLGAIAAAVVGFFTLILAHHLALQGDTMGMMQAVLDSNFWLSTHVVTITIGYSSMFLAGLLGILYLIADRFGFLDDRRKASLFATTYGVVIFSLLLSFVGTVLGGIWADQSWGRFWGWDPKENGALIIVLWAAAIVHAKLSGLLRARGLMQMAIAGNMVTAFSWQGVNLLGIGLHSYGFTESGLFWLILFMLSQLGLIAVGWLPESWRIQIKKEGENG